MKSKTIPDPSPLTSLDLSDLIRRGFLAFAFALIAFVSACNSINTPAPSITLPTATSTPIVLPTAAPGWGTHKNSSFQISLPNSWQEIPLDESALKSKIDAASGDNPHLADTLRGILEGGQFRSFLFYATDKTNANVISNVSVARTTIPSGESIDQAARDYAEALPQVLKGAKLVVLDAPLEINNQKAAEVDYDLPLINAAGQVVTLRGVQYLIWQNSGNAYVVTVTGDAANAEQLVPLARQIGRSFFAIGP